MFFIFISCLILFVGATTDCQDSSDATTADEKPKESVNGKYLFHKKPRVCPIRFSQGKKLRTFNI